MLWPRVGSVALLWSSVASLAFAADPVFYKDILPILQRRCQSCHRPGEPGKMSLVTYSEVRPWATAIREAVKLRKMPPWFADPHYGKFSNDPHLPDSEVALIDAWVVAGAPEGHRPKTLPAAQPKDSWSISPDLVVTVPKPFDIPAKATIEYQYFILPLSSSFDRWVQAVEIQPSERTAVHHAVLYVRPPSSKWLRDVPAGVAWAPPANDPAAVRRARQTTEDILAVYTPGAQASRFPAGMAKKIPSGSDLVLQVHYTSSDRDLHDQTSVGLAVLSQAPKKRILTLQMGRDDLRIPPGDPDYRASVSGTLPRETTLISLLPHMHLRGSAFDFEAYAPGGHSEMLLRVKPYDFFWQMSYVFETPRVLPAGTILKWTGYFDNSRNNPRNPDPAAEVTWGEQSWQEMMIGFFDVAVDPGMEKKDFFVR